MRRIFDKMRFRADRIIASILWFPSCVVRFDDERGLDDDEPARQRALDQMRSRR